jgi:hypothetical protein
MGKNNSLTTPNPLLTFTGIRSFDPVKTVGVPNPFSLCHYCSPLVGEHFFAGVAQLVEQLIRNQQASGSSPLAGFLQEVKSS